MLIKVKEMLVKRKMDFCLDKLLEFLGNEIDNKDLDFELDLFLKWLKMVSEEFLQNLLKVE